MPSKYRRHIGKISTFLSVSHRISRSAFILPVCRGYSGSGDVGKANYVGYPSFSKYVLACEVLYCIVLYCIVLYCGRVPVANAPRMHCSRMLIVQTLVFSRSFLHRQVSPPETLVVKRGTTWARNGRWILPENARLPLNIQGSFTCLKFTTWDKPL